MWLVYMIHCHADDSLYTGVTNNLIKRFRLHRKGRGAKYTKGRGPLTLEKVFFAADKSAALKEEYRIKQLTKAEKLQLKMSVKERATQMLTTLWQAPGMFATSYESFVSQISTILRMAEVDFVVIDFYKKHLGTYGSMYLKCSEMFDDDWAHSAVEDALSLLLKE